MPRDGFGIKPEGDQRFLHLDIKAAEAAENGTLCRFLSGFYKENVGDYYGPERGEHRYLGMVNSR